MLQADNNRLTIAATQSILHELKPGLDEKLYGRHVAVLLDFKDATLQVKRVVI